MPLPALLRRRRFWFAVLVPPCLLAAYALLGFLALPWWVERTAKAQVAASGRTLEIGALHFNPFSFELRLRELSLREADGRALAALGALYVNAAPAASLRERAWVVSALHVDAPDVALRIDAHGRLNWLDVLPPRRETPAEAPAEAPSPSAPPRLRVGELRLAQGRVSLEDHSRPRPFHTTVQPVDFSLRDLRTDLDYRNAYQFTARAQTGESLEWNGDFTVQPLGASGRIALRGLQASTLMAYLQDQLPVHLASGHGELDAHYTLHLNPALALDLRVPRVQLRELALAEPQRPDAVPVRVQALEVQQLHLRLPERQVHVEAVNLRGPSVDLRRAADGALNLQRLLRPASRTAAKDAPRDAPAWQVTLANLDVTQGMLKVEDRGVQPPARVQVSPLNLRLRDLRSDARAPLQVSLDAGIARGGRVRVEGPVQLRPLSAHLTLELKALDLAPVRPYVESRTRVGLQSGALDVRGSVRLNQAAAQPLQLDFSGDAQLTGVALQDRVRNESLLRWKRLDAQGIRYVAQPASLRIETLAWHEPQGRVTIAADRSLNVIEALARPDTSSARTATTQTSPQDAAAPPLAVEIAQIELRDGRLRFTDQSIEPRFSAAIFALGGQVRGLSTQGDARAQLRLDGKVDDFAPVRIEGQLRPLAFDRATDLSLSFSNMDLVRFNPYSGRFAGYHIVKGKLSTELRYRIDERQLQATHHVRLDQLEFGEATGSKDAVPLPVKLGVALLKDRHGVIELDLPVSGSLDDPSFRVAPLVWKAVGNLITKAATAPFAWLARLIGGGEELAYVEFAPGVADLAPAESEKLSRLARALVERPQLRLDIPAARLDALDAPALARQALDARIDELAPAEPGADAARIARRRIEALEALHREHLGREPEPAPVAADADAIAARVAHLESALLPHLAPDESRRARLASARARAMQRVLLTHTGVAPERVFLTTREAARDQNGAVRVALALE